MIGRIPSSTSSACKFSSDDAHLVRYEWRQELTHNLQFDGDPNGLSIERIAVRFLPMWLYFFQRVCIVWTARSARAAFQAWKLPARLVEGNLVSWEKSIAVEPVERRQLLALRISASAGSAPITTGTPALMMPAFSRAMAAILSPRISV